MDNFIKLLENRRFQGAISIVAAIVMYFTPDHIDKVIETLLIALGIEPWILKKKGE